MKELAKNLAITTVVSLVAIPLTIIGVGVGGYIWGKKIEPRLYKKKESTLDEES